MRKGDRPSDAGLAGGPARRHAGPVARAPTPARQARAGGALRGAGGAVSRSRSSAGPTRCCSITSSPTRYGCRKPDLELADADVARGSYVIGLRPGDDDLRRAIDDALGDMIDDGGSAISRALAPAGSAGQLAAAVDEPARGRSPRSSSAQTLDRHQVVLFLAGAWADARRLDRGVGARGAARPRCSRCRGSDGGPDRRALRARRTSRSSAARRCCSSSTSSITASRRCCTARPLDRRHPRARAELRRVRGRGVPRRAAGDPARAGRGRVRARALARADAAASAPAAGAAHRAARR